VHIAFRSTAARVAVLAALAGVAYAVPAAASSSSGVDPAAAKLVPASVKAKGTLVLAADATYAPDEFIGANGQVVGMDVDLGNALFAKLGLKVKFVNAPFNSILLGLQSGKFDIGFSSFTDEKSREKQVNFVDYFYAGESFFEDATGGPKVTNLASLCGLSVSVEDDTTEQSDAQGQVAKCKAEGKKIDAVQSYENQNEANLALSSGRAQVSMADSQVAAYQVAQSHGKFKIVGTTYDVAPYGIAVPKGDGTLDQAMLVGLKDLVQDGQYIAILKKWGIASGADNKPVINGATS
jgi:polar amino acid transport system substrate-binding protein